MGRKYELHEYLEFLFDKRDAPSKELRESFESRIDELFAKFHARPYYGFEVEKPDDLYYLVAADLMGSGVGLWEGREVWHRDFGDFIRKDEEANRRFQAVTREMQNA